MAWVHHIGFILPHLIIFTSLRPKQDGGKEIMEGRALLFVLLLLDPRLGSADCGAHCRVILYYNYY